MEKQVDVLPFLMGKSREGRLITKEHIAMHTNIYNCFV